MLSDHNDGVEISVPRPRITREQMVARLKDIGVTSGFALYINEGQADGLCMFQLPRGRWKVCYAERGELSDERFFDDEGEACAELFRRLQASGAVPFDAKLY